MRRKNRQQRTPPPPKQQPNKDEDFPWEQELQIDYRQTKFYGKRTGKFFDPKKMKKSQDGFLEFEDSIDSSQTPSAKIQKIKTRLGLNQNTDTVQADNAKNNKSTNNHKSLNSKATKNIRNVQKQAYKPKAQKPQKATKPPKDKKIPRQSDFGVNWSFQENSENSTEKKQSIQQSDDIGSEQEILQSIEKVQQLKQTETKGPEKIYKQKLTFNKEDNQEVRQKEELKPNRKTAVNDQQNKEKKYALDGNNKKQSQKIQSKVQIKQQWSPGQTLGSISPGFTQSKSYKKYFPDNLSSVKINRQQNQNTSKTNKTIESILDIFEADNDQTGELNKAIINTQSSYFSNQRKQTDRIQEKKGNEAAFKKPKKTGKEQTKNQQGKKDKKKSKEKQWFSNEPTNMNKDQKTKQVVQLPFLSQSMKKMAEKYHQQQDKVARQEAQKKQKLKLANRKRTFEQIQTDDILDHNKMDKIKSKSEEQRPFKKLKSDTAQSRNIFSKINDKEDRRTVKENQKRDNDIDIDSRNDYNQEEQQQVSRKQRHISKQIDKNIKPKQRPERVNPSKEKQKKKPLKSKSQQRPISKDQKSQIAKSRNNLSKNQKIPSSLKDEDSDDQAIFAPRQYPKRNRVKRLQYWKNEKPVYDQNGRMLNVRSKQLYRLIGFVDETFKGDFDLEETVAKKDKLVQNINLARGQIIDFSGFGQIYSELEIAIQKKMQKQQNPKYVEVYHNGALQDLRTPCHILADTGNFTVQNIGKESVNLQFTLYMNKDEYFP